MIDPVVDSDIPDDFDLLGKYVSDLQTGINVDNSGKSVAGTLKYVTDYTGFSGDASEQSGNYLALHFDTNEPDTTITVELVGGVHGPVDLDSDRVCIFRITDASTQSIKVTTSKDDDIVTKIYDISNLVLTPAPEPPVVETGTLRVTSATDNDGTVSTILNVVLSSENDLSGVTTSVSDTETTIVTPTTTATGYKYECSYDVDVNTANYVQFANVPYGTTFEVRDGMTSIVSYENEFTFTGTSCSEIKEEDVIVGVQGTIREDTPDPTVTVTAIFNWE